MHYMLGLLVLCNLALSYVCDRPPFIFTPLIPVLAGLQTYQAFYNYRVYTLDVPYAFLTHAPDKHRDLSCII